MTNELIVISLFLFFGVCFGFATLQIWHCQQDFIFLVMSITIPGQKYESEILM